VGSSPFLRLAPILLRRPSLWVAALGAAWAFRRTDWYRTPPFLPLPSVRYLRWRMDTAYGDPGHVPPAEELERFLIWGARMRARARRDEMIG
jgi:hypothetical protein